MTPPTNPKTSHIARGWKKHPAHGTILVALLEDMQHTSLKMRCQCLPLSVVSFLNPICHSGVFYLIEIHVYQNSKTPECVKSFLTFTDHLFFLCRVWEYWPNYLSLHLLLINRRKASRYLLVDHQTRADE